MKKRDSQPCAFYVSEALPSRLGNRRVQRLGRTEIVLSGLMSIVRTTPGELHVLLALIDGDPLLAAHEQIAVGQDASDHLSRYDIAGESIAL